MGDQFQMLVDAEVSIEDAGTVAADVFRGLKKRGLIEGQLDADCVLGGTGYRAGPAVAEAYEIDGRSFPFRIKGVDRVLHARELKFWKLRTSGVQSVIGRNFNTMVLGPSHDGLSCPVCKAPVDIRQIDPTFIAAVDEWYSMTGPGLVQCPFCAADVELAMWNFTPPLGIGNLHFKFWNWPNFEASEWLIDIPEMVRDLTGHRIIHTWGRI